MGERFDKAVEKYITTPLNMKNTYFLPTDKQRCAPTRAQTARGPCIQGEVNDDRAFMLGGYAGNAGLFSTAQDLEKFMCMILRNPSSTTIF